MTKQKALGFMFAALLATAAVSAQAQQTMVMDPELGMSMEIAKTSPVAGKGIALLHDSLRAKLRNPPRNAVVPMPKVDVAMIDFRQYSFEPDAATTARAYPDFIGSDGTWTVRRDGVVVCQACSGMAKLSRDGYWVFVQPAGVTDASQVWAVQVTGRKE